MKKAFLLAVLILFLPRTSEGFETRHRFRIVSGPSIRITDASNYADIGLDLGAGYYYRISPRVDIGVSTSLYLYDGGTSFVGFEGFEAIPGFRLNTNPGSGSRVNLFLQYGIGYSYHKEKYPAPLIPPGTSYSGDNEDTYTEPIMEVGVGISTTTQKFMNVELAPLLRFGVGDTEVVTHLSFYAGMVFGW